MPLAHRPWVGTWAAVTQDGLILCASCQGSKFPSKSHAHITLVYFSHDMEKMGDKWGGHNVHGNLNENKTHGDGEESMACKYSNSETNKRFLHLKKLFNMFME